MTRYEKVLSLSLENMANFLSDIQWDSDEPTAKEMYVWLSEEYAGDENDFLYLATDAMRPGKFKTDIKG